jgi:putative nucleotidyltransferase with HDIG domain
MKTFRSSIEKFREWRKPEPDRLSILSSEEDASKKVEESTNQKSFTHLGNCLQKNKTQALVVTLAIASLTGVVGYRFYDRPQLGVETIAPETIAAPRDGSFKDLKTTERRKQELGTDITPVLKRDTNITSQIQQNLANVIDRLEQHRQFVGTFPFVISSGLSLSSQQALRAIPGKLWQQIIKAANTDSSVENLNPNLTKALSELKAYRRQASQAEYQALISQISLARQRYEQTIVGSAQPNQIRLNANELVAFLTLSESDWLKTKTAIAQTSKRILVQGIPQGMPSASLKEAIAVNLDSSSLVKSARSATTNLLEANLKPNLIVDRAETERKIRQMALTIEPTTIEVRQGDIIVEKGEKITQEDFVVLDGLDLSRRGISWGGLAVTGICVSGAVGLFYLVAKRTNQTLRRRDILLLCVLSLSAPMMSILHPRYTSLPAIGLLASSFYNPTLAATQVVLMSGLTGFTLESSGGWAYLLSGTAGGLLAAVIAGRLRSRDELSILGVGVGVTQGSVYFLIKFLLAASMSTLVPGATIFGLLGLAWSIIALGLSPYLERLFDLVTPIRLVELSNPNCGLLKRLATEAPGTFQHTLFVASLAEAAARELHCNVELVRAGTLYHDIGKMHDPLGFIENQMGGPNKHDEINEPWTSAAIIKKHVTEGLAMARKYHLPKVIQDFIPEHQGKLLIAYFYFQAKQRAEQEGKPPVLESDFRYDGPIPQSRETGIVMLADACEAALRSLKEVTPEIATSTINKIFRARWQDGQLAESGIEYEELPKIAEVFVCVWQQVNHQRIIYPKAALETPVSRKSLAN